MSVCGYLLPAPSERAASDCQQLKDQCLNFVLVFTCGKFYITVSNSLLQLHKWTKVAVDVIKAPDGRHQFNLFFKLILVRGDVTVIGHNSGLLGKLTPKTKRFDQNHLCHRVGWKLISSIFQLLDVCKSRSSIIQPSSAQVWWGAMEGLSPAVRGQVKTSVACDEMKTSHAKPVWRKHSHLSATFPRDKPDKHTLQKVK